MKAVWARILSPTKKPGDSRAVLKNNMPTLLATAQKINTNQAGSIDYILKAVVARAPEGVVRLSPEIAQRMLEEINFPDQRVIDSGRVYGHRHAIITGEWMEGHPITIALLPDGRMWLVDGQHRLTAIGESEAPVPITIRDRKSVV